jgi:hypothetical protein
MGRGVRYKYEYGILISPDAFTISGGVLDKNYKFVEEGEAKYEELVAAGNKVIGEDFDSEGYQ